MKKIQFLVLNQKCPGKFFTNAGALMGDFSQATTAPLQYTNALCTPTRNNKNRLPSIFFSTSDVRLFRPNLLLFFFSNLALRSTSNRLYSYTMHVLYSRESETKVAHGWNNSTVSHTRKYTYIGTNFAVQKCSDVGEIIFQRTQRWDISTFLPNNFDRNSKTTKIQSSKHE